MRTTLRLASLTSLLLLSVVAACGDSTANDAGASDTGTGSGDGDGDPTTTGDGDGDGDPTTTGDGDPTTGDGDGDPTTGGDGDPTTGDGDGDPAECVVTECGGKVYECGDCEDNDDDGLIDTQDPNCWGPCDNNEAGFKGNIPGQNMAPCTVMDCYFDSDSGTGNDNCYWSHSCDPSEPNPSSCNYDPDGSIPGGSGMSCSEAQQTQDQQCLDTCAPLVPNGCDCFGCCEINSGDASYTVFLGSGEGDGTCSFADVADPTKCAPCVQVEGCFNACDPDDCEICIGETEIPEDCDEAGCPEGVQSCDPVNNSADCPNNHFCVTGCCYPLPG